MLLFVEIRRRGVFKVGLAYLALAWLLIQVAATVLPAFSVPAWALRAVIVAFAIGFPIALALAWRYELTSDGVRLDAGAAVEPATPRRFSRAPDFAIIGFLVLVVAVLVVDRYSAIGVAVADVDSIAVLPLANLSGDVEQEYFTDGMTDALITSLARLRALKVVSRPSIMRYKSTTLSLPQIAAELGVSAILAGSAVYDGGRVRISIQLIDARTDRNLWALSFDHGQVAALDVQRVPAAGEVLLLLQQIATLVEPRFAGGHRREAHRHSSSVVGYRAVLPEGSEPTPPIARMVGDWVMTVGNIRSTVRTHRVKEAP
jgi:TolB-like protein